MTKSQKIIDIKAHRAMIKHMYETNHPGVKLPLWVYLHDIDKYIMLKMGFGVKLSKKIHRNIAFHHPENIWGILAIEEMVYDWESARFTKPSKPWTAKETLYNLYPNLIKEVLPRLIYEFGDIEEQINKRRY